MLLNVCILGLGSNQNTPTKQLKSATLHINKLPRTQVSQVTGFYQSKPWGVTNQPDFTNSAIKILTQLTPLRLLKEIKKIEYRLMQRQVTATWHSRNIDIDILLYQKSTYHRSQLIIPHPLIEHRCFAILPLLELKPNLPTQLQQKLNQHMKSHDCKEQLIKLKNPLIDDFMNKTIG
jgi:2-amino-4-hydroxy-6-hydroxymethyldihydropteridine diphosphokinase